MAEAATGTTTEALHGPYAGLDLDALVDWPVVRTWLYWGMFWLMVAPTVGATISGMFNYPEYLGTHLGADLRAASPGARQWRHHGRVLGPVHRRVLLPGAAPVRRAGRVQSLGRGSSPGCGTCSWPRAVVGAARLQSRSRGGRAAACSPKFPSSSAPSSPRCSF